MPFDMPSSRAPRSFEREFSEAAVKKLVGLSRAELTFLPEARRPWIVSRPEAMFWRARRFERTPREMVMSDISIPFPRVPCF